MDKYDGSKIATLFSILILGILNSLFIWLLIPNNGTLNLSKFMNPSYKWIIYMGLGQLLLFMILEIRNFFHFRVSGSAAYRTKLLAVLTLSVPILFFVSAKDTYLTAEMKNISAIRTIPFSTGNNAGTQGPMVFDETQQNPFFTPETDPSANDAQNTAKVEEKDSKETSILSLFSDTENYIGKTVSVVGIAHTFPELGNDTLYLYRLMIACCAADAMPVGLIVNWNNRESIKSNQWYRVDGEVTMMKVEGLGDEEHIGIIARALHEAGEPDIPFLF